MKVEYNVITLVYSYPKYVSIILDCACKCGTIKTNSYRCPTYGRVIVECRGCHEQHILPLTREVIQDFHKKKFPLLGGVSSFMDAWEEDMAKK
jgi:hypothetical protein